MSLLGDEGDDFDRPSGPLLPPDDRLWRHPSELAGPGRQRAAQAAPVGARARGPRQSVSVMTGLVLGAGLTAAVMLLTGNDGRRSEASLTSNGTQAGTGGSDSIGAGEAGVASGTTPSTAPAAPSGAVAAGPATASSGAGHGTTPSGVAHPDTAAVPGDLT